MYVTSDLIWDEGITPDNMFRTQDILFGLVKPKIAELSAEVEPAVEETNLFEPDSTHVLCTMHPILRTLLLNLEQ